jgi:hypothetical protein
VLGCCLSMVSRVVNLEGNKVPVIRYSPGLEQCLSGVFAGGEWRAGTYRSPPNRDPSCAGSWARASPPKGCPGVCVSIPRSAPMSISVRYSRGLSVLPCAINPLYLFNSFLSVISCFETFVGIERLLKQIACQSLMIHVCACRSDSYAENEPERMGVRDFGLTEFRPAPFRASDLAIT